MWPFCRKKRVHPVLCNKKPEAARVRQNGWSLPLHPLQAVAWFFILFFSVSYFVFMLPHLPNPMTMWVAGSVTALIFLCHVIVHLVSMSCNPADDSVLAKYKSHKLNNAATPASFDRSKHEHVIENQFCYICEVSVGPKSKHCSVCNKCITDFDHHCKWLNNCVGAKNYRLFLACVSTAFLGSVIIFAVSAFLTVAHFNPGTWLNSSRGPVFGGNATSPQHRTPFNASKDSMSVPIGNAKVAFDQSIPNNSSATNALQPQNDKKMVSNRNTAAPLARETVWIFFVLSSSVLSLVTLILLGHLLCFHLFLYCCGLSTYEFIVKRRQHSRPSDIKPNGVIASGARAHPKKKCSAVTKLLSFRACSNCCRKQTTWEEDVKQRNAIAGDKRAPDVSYSSSVQSSKVDICHISGKELDLNTRSKLQTSSLGVSGLGNDIRDSGLLSGRKNNKIRPFDFKSQSVQDDIHGNVYLGSPHHRLSIEFKSNNSGRFASNFNGSIVPEVLTSESTRCKPVKKMESTDSNNRHKQEPTYPPLFIRTEKVNNDQGFEKADPTNEQQTNGKIELFERQRNHSIVSNGRVSRLSKWSTISGKSDSSIARNARRRNEFLRQKSQEQIASKQRFFQNHSMQIEGHDSGDSPSDTQSLDEMPTLKRAISISPLPRDVTRDRPQGLIDTDLAVDHPSSDQESCASETASQYFTFQPENERIRIKY